MQATKHDDTLYIATVKNYGANDADYVPAIYYAFLRLGPHADLCDINSHKIEGILAAEQDGSRLGLSFPNIVGLHNGGALLIYVLAGAGNLPGNLGPAYAGGLEWQGLSKAKLGPPSVVVPHHLRAEACSVLCLASCHQ